LRENLFLQGEDESDQKNVALTQNTLYYEDTFKVSTAGQAGSNACGDNMRPGEQGLVRSRKSSHVGTFVAKTKPIPRAVSVKQEPTGSIPESHPFREGRMSRIL
jgi:hypothetical protein